MARFINENFVPVKIHIKEQPQAFGRFNAQWTPTLIVRDPQGQERHRIEGFLPAEDLLAQLSLGLARMAFQQNRFAEAQQRYRQIVRDFPNTEAAPEAQYWAGVARYKETNDAAALADVAREFRQRYSDTVWAKKASVWGPAAAGNP